MATNKSFWQKTIEFILAVIFWWPISIIKVCKSEARFEGLTCIALCLVGLMTFFTFVGNINIFRWISIYVLLGAIFSQDNFWINSSKERIGLGS